MARAAPPAPGSSCSWARCVSSSHRTPTPPASDTRTDSGVTPLAAPARPCGLRPDLLYPSTPFRRFNFSSARPPRRLSQPPGSTVRQECDGLTETASPARRATGQTSQHHASEHCVRVCSHSHPDGASPLPEPTESSPLRSAADRAFFATPGFCTFSKYSEDMWPTGQLPQIIPSCPLLQHAPPNGQG